MSGGKNKSSGTQAPALPDALPGPVLNVPPMPQPMPGQMELIAQQLGQGYPSMPRAEILKHLQSIYRPPPPASAPVLPAASGRGISSQGLGGGSGKRHYGSFEGFSDFSNFINSYRK